MLQRVSTVPLFSIHTELNVNRRHTFLDISPMHPHAITATVAIISAKARNDALHESQTLAQPHVLLTCMSST